MLSKNRIIVEVDERCNAKDSGDKMRHVLLLELVERLFGHPLYSPESIIMRFRNEEYGKCEVFLKPYSINKHIFYNIWVWSENMIENWNPMNIFFKTLRANFPNRSVVIDALVMDLL